MYFIFYCSGSQNVPQPTASASSGHLLEMEVLGATRDLLNPKPWGYFPEIHFNRSSRWFRFILKFENDCFHILFSFQRLISFPKPQRMGCSTDAKKEPVYFHFVHWRKTISPKDTPMNLLPGSDDLLIFNAFHLASCLPLWDHMCWFSGPPARGLSICISELTERLQQPWAKKTRLLELHVVFV